MHMIEIAALDNGAHRNQNGYIGDVLPEGWALIPPEMEIPETYPFVNIEVESRTYTREVETENGFADEEYEMMTVVSMEAGVMPEPEPEPEPEPTADELMDILLGVSE